MSVLQKLTEGIVNRNLNKEGAALMDKWERTGLLEGLDGRAKDSMSVLLENQAKELLREASSMAAGDVEGFASVAFPIVRRVFGGLIANDLVSVQPMSLPSGLIFFMDFTFESARAGNAAGESLYGGNVVGKGLVGGVTLGDDPGGFYNLSTGYSSPTGSATCTTPPITTNVDGSSLSALDYDPDLNVEHVIVAANLVVDWSAGNMADMNAEMTTALRVASATAGNATGADDQAWHVDTANDDLLLVLRDDGTGSPFGIGASTDDILIARLSLVRRHTQVTAADGADGQHVVSNIDQLCWKLKSVNSCGQAGDLAGGAGGTACSAFTLAELTAGEAVNADSTLSATILTAVGVEIGLSTFVCDIPLRDNFDTANALGGLVGNDIWGLEEPALATGNVGTAANKNTIAEIDIKVDSVAVTAVTKKLKAKWSPELGQDLQAYHNLDAEVELTSILSEQIGLEIDREILNDLVQGATAGTYYWSRRPGRFLLRDTGAAISSYSNESLLGADFTGTVSEWYETLVETLNDVSAQIHRKTLRGGANFLVCSPEVANILEFTSGFRANITHDDDKGTVGAMKAGNLSKKWDVYVDPYFIRNVILIGRKGGSFLESGYVYAPYVPLQVTPTIFGTEDFVPRKGVMTRYAKKMVRPDLYGLVVIQDFSG